MQCPSCGAPDQTGKYCAECGAALDASCRACGSAVAPGSRFCTSCGEPLTDSSGRGVGAAAGAGGGPAAAGTGGGSSAPWVIAAAALLVVVLVVFLPQRADRVAAPPAGSGAPFGDAGGGASQGTTTGGMPALSSDMRTNADRLFNRIMLAAEQGNRSEVERFMPMAVQAYGMVEDLDEDGLYHLGILHLTAGEHDAARRTARRILDRSPNHILGLGVAASAALEAGDTTAAVALWERLLDAYPEESARPLPEYLDHRNMLEEYRATAREATVGPEPTGGRGIDGRPLRSLRDLGTRWRGGRSSDVATLHRGPSRGVDRRASARRPR